MKEKQVIGYWSIKDRNIRPPEKYMMMYQNSHASIRFEKKALAIKALKDLKKGLRVNYFIPKYEFLENDRVLIVSEKWREARWEIIPVEKEIA